MWESQSLRTWRATPSFRVLEIRRPPLSALLFGAVVALTMLAALPHVMERFGTSDGMQVSMFRLGSGHTTLDRPVAAAQAALKAAVAKETGVDSATRHRVVTSAAEIVRQHYVDHKLGESMANALLTHEKNGDDDAATDGTGFAILLTRQMQDVSHDSQVELIYRETPIPEHPANSTPEDIARYRRAMQQSNCTFERVEILPHRIGYLKLNSFPDVSMCRQTAQSAMAKLNMANAIIFDLRDNRGGLPNMVQLISSYLFDHPEYLYNPRENVTEQSWTRSPVAGNKLADKPVYILTSRRTISGAEQFTYNLKMLRRATIVGETTAGAAHAGAFHRIDDHFGVAITEVRSINPFGQQNWDGVGIEPDVKVNAAEALPTAQRLAGKRVQK